MPLFVLRPPDGAGAYAGNHMNCDKPFDGLGGELAHSWAAGDIHFDDDEDYRSDQQLVDSGWAAAVSGAPGHADGDGGGAAVATTTPDDAGISLQKLAVHEVFVHSFSGLSRCKISP